MPATNPDYKTSASSITSSGATATAAAAPSSAAVALTTPAAQGAERLLTLYCGELKTGEEQVRATRVKQFLTLISQYVATLGDQKQQEALKTELTIFIKQTKHFSLEQLQSVRGALPNADANSNFNINVIKLLFCHNQLNEAIALLVYVLKDINRLTKIIPLCEKHMQILCVIDNAYYKKFCELLLPEIVKLYSFDHDLFHYFLKLIGISYSNKTESFGSAFVADFMKSISHDAKTEKYNNKEKAQLEKLFYLMFDLRDIGGLTDHFTENNKIALEIAVAQVTIILKNCLDDIHRWEYLAWLSKQPGKFVQAVSATFNAQLQQLAKQPLDDKLEHNLLRYKIALLHNDDKAAHNSLFGFDFTTEFQPARSKRAIFVSSSAYSEWRWPLFHTHCLRAHSLDRQPTKSTDVINETLMHCNLAIQLFLQIISIATERDIPNIMRHEFQTEGCRARTSLTFVLIDLFTTRANGYLQQGQHQSALDDYQLVLNLTDAVADVTTLIDAAEKSRRHVELYTDRFTVSPQLFFNMGLCCLALNNPKDAMSNFIYAMQGDEGTKSFHQSCQQQLTQFAQGNKNLHYLAAGLLQPQYVNSNADIRQRLYPHSAQRLELTREFCRQLLSVPVTEAVTEEEQANRRLALQIAQQDRSTPQIYSHTSVIPTILLQLDLAGEGIIYYLTSYLLVTYVAADDKHKHEEKVVTAERPILTRIISTVAGDWIKPLVPTILEYTSSYHSFFNVSRYPLSIRNTFNTCLTEYNQRQIDACNTELTATTPNYPMILRNAYIIINWAELDLHLRIAAYLLQIEINYRENNHAAVIGDCDVVIVLLQTKYKKPDIAQLARELSSYQQNTSSDIITKKEATLLFKILKLRGLANLKLNKRLEASMDFNYANYFHKTDAENNELAQLMEQCEDNDDLDAILDDDTNDEEANHATAATPSI